MISGNLPVLSQMRVSVARWISIRAISNRFGAVLRCPDWTGLVLGPLPFQLLISVTNTWLEG